MRAVLISIKPEWVAKILNGEKKLEIRKTMPKCDLPVDVYIYVCKQRNMKNCLYGLYDNLELLNGKVVAKFTLNKVANIHPNKQLEYEDNEYHYDDEIIEMSCLSDEQLGNYIGDSGYAWFVDNLEIFDEPKELSDYKVKRAFQSWGYVEVD